MTALTAGGENAEAYWSWAGDQLILQARPPGAACDRIFRMPLHLAPPPLSATPPVPVSSGRGATTCSYFLPGDREVIFASTEGGDAACPPRPDHSKGYVWALHPTYDIYRANADGSAARRLTSTPGYDAEGTVCARDGSIVFTSVRDGGIDLYRMDADGGNVRRLTTEVGYDGGAFFNADCTRIVWRASRPRPGPELDDYRRLLAQNLVRPSKLELYVANADGSDPMQVTYLDAASFGPAWQPDGKRLIFASNHGDPRGREFDLWAIDVAGTRLERITAAAGFDGFPLFSPDGRHLAFSSNRATAAGAHDTNVFIAEWAPATVVPAVELGADRVLGDVRWLADPAREGRGVGTPGLEAAGAYIEQRFRALGLQPAGDAGTFRQSFEVRTGVTVDPSTGLRLDGAPADRDAISPAGFSGSGRAAGPLVLAGYGLRDSESGIDDYAHLDVRGKVVVVRRFVPDRPAFGTPERQKRAGDLHHKAWLARERGATALLVVDMPARPADAPADWKPADEATIPRPRPDGYGDAGIPVLLVKRALLAPLWDRLQAATPAKKPKRPAGAGATTTLAPIAAEVNVTMTFTRQPAFNVVARLPAARATAADAAAPPSSSGTVVVGAHYDHLGYGGRHSLAPDSREPHLGADDNASGTATVLEVARQLATGAGVKPARDILFVAFSGEEEGVLGSTHFTRAPPPETKLGDLRAMINLDMVGRLRGNRATVFGVPSTEEWPALVDAACAAARIDCAPAGSDGFGPSDQMPFYAAGVPVVHFFTGSHADYHKPSDSADRINAAGAAQIATAVSALATAVAARTQALTFKSMSTPAPEGDVRSFNASLGTVPDYAGPPGGVRGVLLAGVRPGGGAEKAGLRRGDILIRLGLHEIGGVEDLMYALNASKPGQTVTATVLRDGHQVQLPVTFQEGRRGK